MFGLGFFEVLILMAVFAILVFGSGALFFVVRAATRR